ncbi:G-protein coupled receptor Mth-like [Lingula anatina]|uniref:G-protein coupled receptor Mth-like n=1 Tax=Lingula anatina TaxID=7574 RepID=A0A1S3IH37_LINAN|nr:G-protein coupled receptor Mth-like [Lingula anatina]|eukprot:XP_013396799.1 G-protein coupled receptor Mth-like [Lingula anatina]
MTIINESDVLYDNNGSILVCRNLLNFTVSSNPQDNLSGDDSKEALGILTIVCIAISLVCLLIRIALQPFVALFQTFPGKLQLSLCLSLVLWKVFFLARPFASLSGDVSACIAVAALFHWSLLASFFWMNVIAIDLWKTFRRTSSLQISAESNKTIFGYVCYATLLPGGIVALCLVLDYVDIDSQFQPHYSGPACYISNIYPLVLFLVAPIGVILIVNIVLFAMIARSIHIAISEAGKLKAKRNKHTFLIYVRLFALMGTTWLFGFLSGGLNVLALNFIFVILTTLDGLFIFIAVVCSRRVWRDLRDRKIITRSSTRTLTLSSSNKLPPTPKSPTPSESNSLKFSLKQDTSLSRL